MQTIAIDCRFAATKSGLGRYTSELVSHLVARGEFRCTLIVRSTDEGWIPQNPALCTIVRADVAHYSIAEQFVIPSLLSDFPADLYFSPHFNVPYSCPLPFVVTIHDLILHRYPNRANILKRRMYEMLFSHAVKKARRIVTVSPFVKGELADVCGADIAAKVTVITEGVDDAFHPASSDMIDHIRRKYDLSKPYFLYVGNCKQHKNVPLLLEAFEKSGRTDAELILLTSGKEADMLTSLPSHVRKIADVSDAELPAFYSGAVACVTASLYEGFCLPVAEALACGCPVIATNRSAIPDIASGHALLLEPTVDAFAQAFLEPPQKIHPYAVGSWDDAAEKTALLFKETLR